jgi:hypothetical protein
MAAFAELALELLFATAHLGNPLRQPRDERQAVFQV